MNVCDEPAAIQAGVCVCVRVCVYECMSSRVYACIG